MHHYRGSLWDGETVLLNPANVYIHFHGPPDEPHAAWNGYLVVESETEVAPEGTYRLKLTDGRAGELSIDHIGPDDSGTLRAYFVGQGPMA